METALGGRKDSHESRTKASALFSQMVGSLVLSRAVAEADPAPADKILLAGRWQLLQAVGTEAVPD